MANPNTNTAEDLSKLDLPFANEVTAGAETYADKKGIPVEFKTDSGRLIEGRLIEWEDDEHFRVVGFDGDTLITKVFKARELYDMNELPEEERERYEREVTKEAPVPTRLENAVALLRQNKNDAELGGTQIRSMLKTVFEPTVQPEAMPTETEPREAA